jgi:hypothetical protein
VQGLNDAILTLILPLVVVFDQLHQISLLEIAAYPIFLAHVTQNPVALEYTVLELPNVQVSIFKPFLAKAV